MSVYSARLGMLLASLCCFGVAPSAASATEVTIKHVKLKGTTAEPEIVISGSGFGTKPEKYIAPCAGTGEDYESSFFVIDETPADQFEAGDHGINPHGSESYDCVGLIINKWTNTKIIAHFGSFYGEGGYHVEKGDIFEAYVLGVKKTITAKFPKAK
jgi:hypothetical protein